jgi:hypothetical protein
MSIVVAGNFLDLPGRGAVTATPMPCFDDSSAVPGSTVGSEAKVLRDA